MWPSSDASSRLIDQKDVPGGVADDDGIRDRGNQGKKQLVEGTEGATLYGHKGVWSHNGAHCQSVLVRW